MEEVGTYCFEWRKQKSVVVVVVAVVAVVIVVVVVIVVHGSSGKTFVGSLLRGVHCCPEPLSSIRIFSGIMWEPGDVPDSIPLI